MKEQKFRHELKYLITSAQIPLIQNRINHLLQPDSHAGQDGSYTVRSLYFDDYDDHCYYENENGTDPREKFRIRIYNGNTDRILLECKRKERGKTLKNSSELSLQQTRQLMQGKVLPDIGNHPQPLQKLSEQMLTRHMRPVVIVEYERIPYVYTSGNVRVTLDTNIVASSEVQKFLEPLLPKRPVLPAGQHLMEVKYDRFLPDFVYRSLQLQNLQQTTFSKYYICRRFTR